ncbi:venom carboxylesterase-6-like [Orussus abietinus]|uniref:venom carboxylesterase-6-like n=1 Tax=Orussus abietinus TaxID=222816 RepID=UPI0006260863|nr:venom carboxylesterase-6-like [Orussus abietinus]XP_012287400.1 venom carboxylesterase-6-like [Orussus abietinus]
MAPIVRVKQGLLKGYVERNVAGGEFFCFRGIPFAEPPVGELRFQDPQPAKSWKGIREAVQDGGESVQQDIVSKEVIGGEDCLYLNVSTESFDKPKPVMFWIHGGSFVVGSNSHEIFRPDYLIKHGVVFVSTNYRLGFLGFSNLDHPLVSGNQGLKDLKAALQWVQENIRSFGGDPENVTIFGGSAGSSCVHYLCVSPSSKGLFHKAIMQSHSLFNPPSFRKNSLPLGFKMAAILEKETSDVEELVTFFRSLPLKELMEAQSKITTNLTLDDLEMTVGPSIDDKSPTPFCAISGMELAKQGIRVPLIIGFNSFEGALKLINHRENWHEWLEDHFEEILKTVAKVRNVCGKPEIVKIIKDMYFEGGPVTSSHVNEYLHFMGDVTIYNGIQKVIELQADLETPTFVYKFVHVPKFSILETVTKTKVNESTHGDELSCLFHIPKFTGDKSYQSGTMDYLVTERMTRMWTDFAKTGTPTPKIDDVITRKWPPLTSSAKNYLEISEQLVPGINPNGDMWKKWKPLLE